MAQDTPIYAGLSVADHLRLGARLNPGWDDALAGDRIGQLGAAIRRQRAGKLSGGQRAQLALTLAMAKRPELLHPGRAGRQPRPAGPPRVPEDLIEIVAEHELSVVLSSHLVADLERVCDYLIVLVASRVQLAGEVERAARHPPPAHRDARRTRARLPRRARTSSRPATPTARAPSWCARPAPVSTIRPGRSTR